MNDSLTSVLPIYTLGILSLAIVIAIALFWLSLPKNWAYFFYALYSLNMMLLVLRGAFYEQGIISSQWSIITYSFAIDVLSGVFYSIFAYYFIEDLIDRNRKILRPFTNFYLSFLLGYLFLFLLLMLFGVSRSWLVTIHQNFLLITTSVGTIGVLFFVTRLPTVLMVFILLGSLSLVLGASLSIYTTEGYFPILVQNDEVVINLENFNVSYLQIAIILDTICFGIAIIKKQQYQKQLLQNQLQPANQHLTLDPPIEKQYLAAMMNGTRTKIDVATIILIQSTKSGRLEAHFKDNDIYSIGILQEKFQAIQAVLSKIEFFVARNRNPQVIIQKKFIRSISDVLVEDKKVKYQSTATMVNGSEVIIAKNKKAEFERWHQS